MVEDSLTSQFEANRPRLHAVAYRMLGSRADADDAVQEAWLRLSRTDAGEIENLGGWLTTVIGRVCLDKLRTRRSRREEPIDVAGPHEPAGDARDDDPASDTVLAESVGAALLVVLDRLSPAERVAFVLHDVFAVPFDQVGEILGRSPDASRQLASRARRRLQGSTDAYGIDLVRQRHVVDAFLRAARGGDFEALMRVLDPDVVLLPDAAAVNMGSLREARGRRPSRPRCRAARAARSSRSSTASPASCGRLVVRRAVSWSSPSATTRSSRSTSRATRTASSGSTS